MSRSYEERFGDLEDRVAELEAKLAVLGEHVHHLSKDRMRELLERQYGPAKAKKEDNG